MTTAIIKKLRSDKELRKIEWEYRASFKSAQKADKVTDYHRNRIERATAARTSEIKFIVELHDLELSEGYSVFDEMRIK